MAYHNSHLIKNFFIYQFIRGWAGLESTERENYVLGVMC